MAMDETDDLVLLRRWRSGDALAGKTLVRRHIEGLHRFFASKGVDDGNDLVNDTFLACFETKADPCAIECFRAWLFGAARNLLLRRWRQRPAFDPATSSIAQLGPRASTLLVFAENHRRLAYALWRIPLDDQIVLELYYWEGLKTPELATVLGVAEPTARKHLQRARRRLLDRFEGAPGEDHDADLEAWLAAVRPLIPPVA
jgi:RNA polymerase sigma factor (sigma-70 family)